MTLSMCFSPQWQETMIPYFKEFQYLQEVSDPLAYCDMDFTCPDPSVLSADILILLADLCGS